MAELPKDQAFGMLGFFISCGILTWGDEHKK